MQVPCLVCKRFSVKVANLRGRADFEKALLKLIPGLPTGEPIYSCGECLMKLIQSIHEDHLTLSIDNVLRNTSEVAAADSVQSSLDVVDEETGEYSVGSISNESSRSNIVTGLGPVNTDSLSTQSQQFLPVIPHSRPGPKSSKRPRENEAELANQSRRELTAEEIFKNGLNAQISQALKRQANKRRHRRKATPSITSTSLESSSSTSGRIQIPSNVSSRNQGPLMNPAPSRRPGPRLNSEPARSSVESTPSPAPQRLVVRNQQSSSPDSPPPPPPRRLRSDDGNSHSNGAAPRRINSSVEDVRSSRDAIFKNFGG